MKENSYSWKVEEINAGRLDKYLCERLPELSRSRIQSLIEDGNVTLDGKSTTASTKPRVGQYINVQIEPPEPLELEPENLPITIVYEDKEIAVINKPQGMVCLLYTSPAQR